MYIEVHVKNDQRSKNKEHIDVSVQLSGQNQKMEIGAWVPNNMGFLNVSLKQN